MSWSEDDLKLLSGRALAIAKMPGHDRDPKVRALVQAEIDAAKRKRGLPIDPPAEPDQE